MVTVTEQYEAFPYPERNPADEKKRLILGSPSHPAEMDHFLWGGMRDWSVPLRCLVAGGGTGDGLIQLAAILTAAGKPYEITYLDLSKSARQIAEARAKVRGLANITFHTGSLLDAPSSGPFDYIDCCGVLHHLPDPPAGFRALRAALAEGGGIGFMVYAPFGRSGVYPLQDAFGALFAGLSPEERLRRAKKVLKTLPPAHPFFLNRNLGDHAESDAGFYDLLLHGQDRPYTVPELLHTLAEADLRLTSFVTPAHYDLGRFTEIPEGMSREDQWAIAEGLNGAIKTHIGYAVPSADTDRWPATGTNRSLIPHLKGVSTTALAKAVAAGRSIPISEGATKAQLDLPKSSAPAIAGIDGKRSLTEIAATLGMDTLSFGATWMTVEKTLVPWGLIRYSGLNR